VSAQDDCAARSLRQAVICGSVMASFNVEAFSLDRMRKLQKREIWARFQKFEEIAHFESLAEFSA
jgi:hypothetical protein